MPCFTCISTTSPMKENAILNGEVARGMEPSLPEQTPIEIAFRRSWNAFVGWRWTPPTLHPRDRANHNHIQKVHYEVLLTLMQAEAQPIGMRIERLRPNTDWEVVWKKLWTTPAPESTKSSWYRIIHDIVQTQERLHQIRITPTDQCRSCAEDTLRHRILGCGAGRYQWGWTRNGVALTLRTETRWVPEEWIFRPHFQFWPPKRHRSVLCLWTQFVAFQS